MTPKGLDQAYHQPWGKACYHCKLWGGWGLGGVVWGDECETHVHFSRSLYFHINEPHLGLPDTAPTWYASLITKHFHTPPDHHPPTPHLTSYVRMYIFPIRSNCKYTVVREEWVEAVKKEKTLRFLRMYFWPVSAYSGVASCALSAGAHGASIWK